MQEVQKKYEFQAQIGQGSFSKIYLVKNRLTEQQWAVKHTDKKIVKPKNYQREVDVLRRISHRKHPNIVAVEEILEDEENVFIVQEYLPAGNLLIYLSRHAPLAESHAQRIYAPILDAMEFLHSCGIAHRDIKLENILMTADGVPKIIDFNLSCFWDEDSKQTTFCGSQEYCAPEIFLRHSYKGPEVDVWSLGVLLYTLLFCEFPFKPTKDANNTPVPISSKVIKCELNFPEQHFASEAAVEVIRYALDPSFSTRPTLRQVLNLSWFRSEKVEPLVFASAFKAPSANDMVLHTNSHNQEELHEEYLKKYYNEQFHPSSSDPERKGKLRERSNTSIGVVTTPQSNFKTFWAKVLRVGKSLHFHSNV